MTLRSQCNNCHAVDQFYTDWAQGDRICTQCGVVDEEHLRETGPEWRDYNEVEDIVKGGPAVARCGMVPVDETKYVGGLQPTRLSSQCFGGGAQPSSLPLLVAGGEVVQGSASGGKSPFRKMKSPGVFSGLVEPKATVESIFFAAR